MNINELPIGVFDSGMGGLTVLRAMIERLPHENMLYLGDTARLPYGTKSAATVARYARQAAARLVERKIKLLVIACNTASASGLEVLRAAWPDLPVIGVIEPGAEAACAATRNNRIAVLATESTIRGQAYQKAIRALKPEADVVAQPCSLFVPLAEEGWMDGPIVEGVARRYLGNIFRLAPEAGQDPGRAAPEHAAPDRVAPEHAAPDCLVLGCTHFPPLAGALRRVLVGAEGAGVRIVDSADTTARAVEKLLNGRGLLNPQPGPGHFSFLTTDDAGRFARIGEYFLGRPIAQEEVELVNL
ncbi:glutamate racemase [Desulfovibrio sp. OttesenSCG-928-C14]|nr:glutamate racemase [Desulfovibrio sp. OttesenSCG-928-C14]